MVFHHPEIIVVSLMSIFVLHLHVQTRSQKCGLGWEFECRRHLNGDAEGADTNGAWGGGIPFPSRGGFWGGGYREILLDFLLQDGAF